MKSQNQRILIALKKGRALTPLDALRDHGVYRLAARILELKIEGHDISRKMITVHNQFGEPCRVASYRLDAK